MNGEGTAMEEGNFYTHPSTSFSHTSLLFHQPFDFETKKQYNLKVRAENLEYDGKENSATTTLRVALFHMHRY